MNELTFSLYTTVHQTQPESHISFTELCHMAVNPAETEKLKTVAIHPSSSPRKTVEVVKQNNQMICCWVDIDSGNQSLADLEAIASQYGIQQYCIYSTASANRLKPVKREEKEVEELQGNRWRVVVPITQAVCCKEWLVLQELLARIFGGGGEAVRLQQIFFAPTNPDSGYYDYVVHAASEPLDPKHLPDAFEPVIDTLAAELEVAKAANAQSEPRDQATLDKSGNIIQRVNQTYTAAEVLIEYGYEQYGESKFLYLGSQSGSPGVYILKDKNDGRERVYSHHEHDPLHNGHASDVFDVLTILKFDDDVDQAVAYYANTLDPEGQKQRQKEYAIEKATTRAIEDFGVVDVHSSAAPIVAWPHLNGNGNPRNTLPNLQHLLQHFGISVRYNVIKKRLEVQIPGVRAVPDNIDETNLTYIISLAQLNGLPKGNIYDYLKAIGDSQPYNPVLEFITSRPWDGQSRIQELIDTIETTEAFDREFLAVIIRKWLISAVAAASMYMGFHARGVLVFQGPQGCGKTSWLRRLCPPEIVAYFKEGALIDPANKDTIFTAVEHWIVEMGELDATFRRADIARLKSMITQSVDKARRAYGRVDSEYQRRTVFCGSVNDSNFLVDDSGNSRFWVIPILSLDYQHNIDMQQLWVEIYELYKEDATWWLTAEEEALLTISNESFRRMDAVEETLRKHFAEIDHDLGVTQCLTVKEILSEVGYYKPTNPEYQLAGKILGKLEFSHKRKSAGSSYRVPLTKGQIAALFTDNKSKVPVSVEGLEWEAAFREYLREHSAGFMTHEIEERLDEFLLFC